MAEVGGVPPKLSDRL